MTKTFPIFIIKMAYRIIEKWLLTANEGDSKTFINTKKFVLKAEVTSDYRRQFSLHMVVKAHKKQLQWYYEKYEFEHNWDIMQQQMKDKIWQNTKKLVVVNRSTAAIMVRSGVYPISFNK